MNLPTLFISSSNDDLSTAWALGQLLEPSASTVFWSETAFNPSSSTLESLARIADKADFAVFLINLPDDRASIRQNRIFDLGFLAGRIGAQRIFLMNTTSNQPSLPFDLAEFNYLTSDVTKAAAAIRNGMQRIGPKSEDVLQFYSCFISYAYSDSNFANQLHNDLEQVGVRCWLDANDLKAGDRLYMTIDKAVRVHDKLIVILSHQSLNSEWVNREISIAYKLEQTTGKNLLFPIRLDDSVFEIDEVNEIRLLKERHIADFRNWKSEAHYRRSFARLVRDLTIQASIESEAKK